MSIRKAGVTFYPGVGVSPDLSGLADTLTLKYKKRGDADFTISEESFTEENPGTYTTPLNLSSVGDYIVIIESTDTRIENLEGNVLVTAASIDDVNAAVQNLQSDMTDIKAQIDALDEAELNGIKEQVQELSTHIATIEGLLDGDDNASLNVLKSLIEDISNSGLDSISTFVDNVELMLEGKEYIDTEGNVVSAEDSKGLREIFDAIDSSGGDTTYIRGKIDDVIINMNNYYDGVTDNQVIIKGKINDVVIPGLEEVKAVVDANKAHLEDSGYGLDALKTLLDNLTLSVGNISTDNSDVLDVLNDGTNGLAAIKDSIMNKLDSMDAKLDNIATATTSRIFV
jgi:prefoldin subunit 5